MYPAPTWMEFLLDVEAALKKPESTATLKWRLTVLVPIRRRRTLSDAIFAVLLDDLAISYIKWDRKDNATLSIITRHGHAVRFSGNLAVETAFAPALSVPDFIGY